MHARIGTPVFLAALFLTICWPSFAREPLEIVIISDINGRYGSTGYHRRVAVAVSQIISLEPDLVISTGDMVAGQRPSPKLQRLELDAMWDSFHQTIRRPLEAAGIPVIMTPGNHDASAYPGFEGERAAYADYHRAHPPTVTLEPGGFFPFYFSLEFGGLLLASLDATRSGELPVEQRDWLRAKLQGEHLAAPKILFGHLPMQPIASGRESDVINDTALEQLLQQSGNVSYLSGHHHAYYPGQRQGINMFSMGNLGGNQRKLIDGGNATGFSFALMRVDSLGVATIKAFAGPGFEDTVPITSLPAQLGNGDHQLTRYRGSSGNLENALDE
ncbi:hypothetical protein EY643_01075 [Halioglobus maricola]|uniref:Calcineurin-like phosphoesterase domain-containing protein n=1 Tax=Halioglobus maricola TaxID=2601894 RepID=A0A5P9NF26_9GAMM|nr:metallophosphoesterase [Halioglobus maricola]QFU74352.1 hypothetical protein EY643_01075 [Halioglobus maricola]